MPLIKVDLPAPLGPMIVTISPWSTFRDAPLTTSTGPYPAKRPLTRSSGVNSATKVRLSHIGIGTDLVGMAVGDDRTRRHDDQTGHEADHERDVVLDEDDRLPARRQPAQRGHDRLGQHRVHTGSGFVHD